MHRRPHRVSSCGPYLCGNQIVALRPLDGVAVWVSTRHAGCLPRRSIHASLDGVNNHNVMLFDLNSCALENFECHYNKFCAQQDLKPFLKEELQAELASRFDCKFKRVRIGA